MAKAIMIQGTMSNVGKSLLAAGLCRIFARDGYRVSPFKSQNMALNSFITPEGLEMGRAQVMQAEAAGVTPSVCMNPILLKPTNDTGSQVIVNGEVRANMSARDYFRYKKQLIPDILAAYHSLEEKSDIIVIEGAGSPAEINLKADDIVNMGMAKMAKAPVLLVGDIDRGGVFAQLAGTMMLLEEGEKQLVKGLIINKFRGDKTILDPGIVMLEELCSRPVVGVTPYMDIDVEDEDSLSDRIEQAAAPGLIDLAVVRLPRISNFTDFNIFSSIEGVSVRYVRRPDQLGSPDLIFLPGTKNTMGDLKWLRQSGMEAAVKKAEARGCVIFGICGGYQMLGERICDPAGAEEGGEMAGMGLLPVKTVFSAEKTRSRVEGRFEAPGGVLHALSGTPFSGYEIHMGQTDFCSGRCGGSASGETVSGQNEALPVGALKVGVENSIRNVCMQSSQTGAESKSTGQCLVSFEDKIRNSVRCDGAYRGNVYGCYVHGLFDRQEAAQALVEALAGRKGIDLSGLAAMDYAAYKELQYDRLADILTEHLDMKQIYVILEAGV